MLRPARRPSTSANGVLCPAHAAGRAVGFAPPIPPPPSPHLRCPVSSRAMPGEQRVAGGQLEPLSSGTGGVLRAGSSAHRRRSSRRSPARLPSRHVSPPLASVLPPPPADVEPMQGRQLERPGAHTAKDGGGGVADGHWPCERNGHAWWPLSSDARWDRRRPPIAFHCGGRTERPPARMGYPPRWYSLLLSVSPHRYMT